MVYLYTVSWGMHIWKHEYHCTPAPRNDIASAFSCLHCDTIYIYIYSTYRYYRRYSGIISNRRCFLGVRPNAFQIEDIAECKSSSNDQKSKNKPLNIGMIFGISSIWKSFVPLLFFVFFAGKLSKINRTLTPGPGGPPEEESAKVPPEVGPGRRYFGTLAFAGGVGEKLFKNHGFLSFFDWGMVIQTTFQIEDNL